MRESILTIPISEIFENEHGCPFCSMRDMLENRTVEYIMGAAMMEPDVRIETNKLGFCHTHLSQMMKQKNRLSLALMLQTNLEETKTVLFSKKSLFEAKNSRAIKLQTLNNSCFVCEKVKWGEERLMKTFFELYNTPEFHETLITREYICLIHFEELLEIAPKYLKKDSIKKFEKDISDLCEKYLDSLYTDVSHYCSMYDYRNTGKDADWGNSKDSIERAVKFLTSRE